MKLPAYPKYKASGVEWLGEVPEQWETRRLKHISDVITVGVVVNPSSYVTDEGVPFLLGGDIREFRIDTSNCNYCSPESSDGPLRKSRLNGGDLVVVRVGYPGVAAVVPPKLEGANCASLTLIRHHKRFCSQWLAYLFNSQVGRDQIEKVQYGAAQKVFNISHAVDFEFPFPPLTEQVAIAEFLDHETGRMDRLVAKKRDLIERLKEKRTTLISRTVTQGLPPAVARAAGLPENPPLKPSGLDWLGDIPKNWEVKPFRHLINGGTRNGLYKAPEYFDPDGTPMIQMGEAFSAPMIESTADDRVRLTAQEKSIWGLRSDDLLFARRSLVFEGSGKCSMVGNLSELHVFESSLIRVRPEPEKINPAFLFWFLRSDFSRAQILATTKQVTISGIDSQQLKSIAILVPSQTEQTAIAAYLDAETAKLDALVAKVETAIERLQEYRTALITAAVTGKIDVREVER